jgi:hypothetical protein
VVDHGFDVVGFDFLVAGRLGAVLLVGISICLHLAAAFDQDVPL